MPDCIDLKVLLVSFIDGKIKNILDYSSKPYSFGQVKLSSFQKDKGIDVTMSSNSRILHCFHDRKFGSSNETVIL